MHLNLIRSNRSGITASTASLLTIFLMMYSHLRGQYVILLSISVHRNLCYVRSSKKPGLSFQDSPDCWESELLLISLLKRKIVFVLHRKISCCPYTGWDSQRRPDWCWCNSIRSIYEELSRLIYRTERQIRVVVIDRRITQGTQRKQYFLLSKHSPYFPCFVNSIITL